MLYRLRKFIPNSLVSSLRASLPFKVYHRNKLKEKLICINAEVTTKCNNECCMCTRRSLLKNNKILVKNMDDELINKILKSIKEFNKNGYKIIFLPMGLGEPLLYGGIFKLFKQIKDINQNIKIILTTNGILLNSLNIKKIIDGKEGKIDEVVISLNSLNELDYLRKMGTNNYKTVKNNITNFFVQRNNRNVESPALSIQYLDYENNQKMLNEEIKSWLKFMRGKDKCFIHPIVNQGGLYSSHISEKPFSRFPCTQPLQQISIKVDGDIYPCCSCFYSGSNKIESLYLGNMKSTNLFTLFTQKNSLAKSIFKKMKKDDYTGLPLCKKCDVPLLSANCFFKIPKLFRINKFVSHMLEINKFVSHMLEIKGYKWL